MLTDRFRPTSQDEPHWSWADALAAARPGERHRIVAILFSEVRERLARLGLAEDDLVRCVANDHAFVTLEGPGGARIDVERQYAWFVQVEPALGEPDGVEPTY